MIIRLPTLIGALGLAVTASYTYQVKQSVKALESELRDIRRQTEEAQERTQNLQAEWARLNDQERLRNLSERQLPNLVPMQPAQFARMEDAVRRLPVAVAFAGPVGAFAPRQESVALADAAPAPEPAAPRPTQLADAGRAAARPTPAPAPAPTAAAQPEPAAAAPSASAPRAARSTQPAATPPAAPQPAAPPPVAAAPAAPAPVVVARAEPRAPRPPAPVVRERQALPSGAAPAAPPPAAAAARSLPSVAAPRAPSSVTAPEPAPAPAAVAAAAPAPAPRRTPPRDGAALPPVAANPAPIRAAMHVQRYDGSTSLLGGQGSTLAPPVPFGR
ncbi:hypothetical protein EOD42_06450 [Rhodovarius crocodyli]|uniref:Cell division protein FtsL n=1 Tax=Rhodovarius crocodyli TaxID=1979269 RepID=A0A437MIK6_9PROT|nr:hypothetical protein [Rhodovarius crocodyli]RVT97465.1 hypothetical protein EOD42_06450 [Rhodovarius crocodyli]